MQLYMMGLSYKTADVDVRESVAISRPHLASALCSLTAYEGVRGAVILSTCNRTEIYVDAQSPDLAREGIRSFLREYRQVDVDEFEPHLYRREGFEAVHHLFSVVSSLDSMVLGEQQITGQVRNAFRQAMQAGTCTMVLARMFRQALTCGKRVRNETGISESHVSVSTVAIDVARAEFESFHDKTVLIVGSGEMSELAARYLQEQGVKSFIVSSRTYAHACTLAHELCGTARQFDELPELLRQADIVISSTAAPHYILVPSLLAGCKDHVLILDIALPRDVDPACGDIPGVTLYDLDGLGEIIAGNQEKRRQAADEARSIVEDETRAFVAWVGEHAVVPTIKKMRGDAEAIRAHEIEHMVKCLDANLSEDDMRVVECATRAIVNKILHEPTVRMKQSASHNRDFECVEAVRYLFGYSDGMVEHARSLAEDAESVGAGSAAPHAMPPHPIPHAHFTFGPNGAPHMSEADMKAMREGLFASAATNE